VHILIIIASTTAHCTFNKINFKDPETDEENIAEINPLFVLAQDSKS
jgi:hypothetical protein